MWNITRTTRSQLTTNPQVLCKPAIIVLNYPPVHILAESLSKRQQQNLETCPSSKKHLTTYITRANTPCAIHGQHSDVNGPESVNDKSLISWVGLSTSDSECGATYMIRRVLSCRFWAASSSAGVQDGRSLNTQHASIPHSRTCNKLIPQ